METISSCKSASLVLRCLALLAFWLRALARSSLALFPLGPFLDFSAIFPGYRPKNGFLPHSTPGRFTTAYMDGPNDFCYSI